MKKMMSAPPPVPPVAAAKAPAKVAKPAVPTVPAVPQVSPLARAPNQATSRQVPSVPTPRGVVRTDTHNAANRVPAQAKHKRRGF